jgi:hypothetical protein
LTTALVTREFAPVLAVAEFGVSFGCRRAVPLC